MIKNIGKYYLYRHIRLDKNEPFYIGIGTKNEKRHTKVETEYLRAYSKDRLNNMWNKIINKTNYEVEILLESDDYEFIKQKEIELVALYGRKDLGTGCLANLTGGGEGVGKLSAETAKKKSEKMMGENNPQWGKTKELSVNFGKPSILRGVKQTKEHIEKRFINLKSTYETFIYGDLLDLNNKCPKCKYVINISTGIIWSSIISCAKDNDFSRISLKNHLSGNSRSNKKYKDYEYFIEGKEYIISNKEYNHPLAKKTMCIDTGEIFESVSEASIKLGISSQSISRVCRGEIEKTHNKKFKYIV